MLIDCHNHVGIELVSYFSGAFPYGQHLQTMVQEGRELGVRRWIVFPMVSHLALNLEAMRKGKMQLGGLEKVPYAWENRRMMQEIYELFPEEGKDTIPFAMFDPARNIAGQEKALRQLRQEYSFYGLKTQPTILQSPITKLKEEARIFLELAEEWDIPVLIHSSVLESDIWSQARDILDVAETAPNVRFIVAHSARFDREQLNRLNAMPNCWFDCSAHRIHCDLAVQDNPIVASRERRFDSDYSRPAQVLRDLAQAYPNKLMWGSDSPYYSYVGVHDGMTIRLASTYAQEVSVVHALPLELQREIGETNTLACLKMKD
jgi:predicted TIM-barrel fold metal-dependent hydrolase